ncbi:MAG: hypothetical protein SFZ02_18025 [bacterium]|nr:hypothetical protein [bacterium]
MKHYWAFLVIILVFSSIHSPMTTAQDRPLSDYPIITAQNVSQLEQLKVLGEGYIRDVIFSPDEQFVAMATSVGIWLYSADDLETPIRLFGDYAIDVTYAMFNADGSRLYGGIQGGSVYIWDVASGELLTLLQAAESEWGLGMLGMELSDDEQLLYIIHDESLNIWNLKNGEIEKVITYRFACNGDYLRYNRQAFSPDKTYLLSSCYIEYPPESPNTPKVRSSTNLINIETSEIYPIEHERHIVGIHFNDTGTRLIGVLTGGYFAIWDTESQTLLSEFGENRMGYKSPTYAKHSYATNYQWNSYAYSQYPEIGILTEDDAKFIELNGYGLIWDIATNSSTHLFSMNLQAKIDEPFNPYQTFSLNEHMDENEAQEILEKYDIAHRVSLYYMDYSNYNYEYITLHPSPQFKHLVGLTENELLIWDAETDTPPFRIDLKSSCQGRYYSYNTELGLDNTRLLSQQYNFTCIWDTASNDLLHAIDNATYTALSENYASVIVSDDSENQILQLWDLSTDSFSEFPIQGYVKVTRFSLNEEFLVALLNNDPNGDVFVWDIETRNLITSFSFASGGWNIDLKISSDNSLVVAYNEAGNKHAPNADIHVWDTQTWNRLYYIDKYYEEYIRCLSFSTQGNFLLVGYTGDIEGTDIWDAKTGNLITTLPDVCAYFSDEASIFNHDDSQLALLGRTETNQRVINIIDTVSFEPIHSLNSGGIYEFSPITNLLLVVRDNILEVWDTDSGLFVFSVSLASDVSDAKFNADGNLIITEMKDGTIRIWGIGE